MILRDIQFDRTRCFDVIIGVCGTERRASYICRLGVRGGRMLAIDFPEGQSYDWNAEVMREAGWTILPLRSLLTLLQQDYGDRGIPSLCIDISSMSRKTLAAIVEWLHSGNVRIERVEFAYCPAEFHSSVQAAYESTLIQARPVSRFFAGHPRSNLLPIGLVLGVGLEPGRAESIIELLEPKRSWGFVPVGGDPRFAQRSDEVVRALSGSGQIETLVNYPLHSIEAAYHRLDSLLFVTKSRYRMVISPSGPNIFGLAAQLVAADRHTDRPAVWRVGGSVNQNPRDVTEDGEVVAAEVVLASEKVGYT